MPAWLQDGYVIFAFIVVTLPLIALYVYTIVDIIRREGMSNIKKAGWGVWIILIPAIGVLTYLAIRPTPPPLGKSGDAAHTGVASEVQELRRRSQQGEMDEASFVSAKRALFNL